MDLEHIAKSHVLNSILEFRRLGRREFLKRYKFGRARTRWIVHEGRTYDAKAIVGVARGHARPEKGPLTGSYDKYTTDYARSVLNRLKFKVVKDESDHSIPSEAADDGSFDPSIVRDTRKRALHSICLRRGQQKFRDSLLEAYGDQCVVTDCSVPDVLEAAHIFPYQGSDTNRVANGLLLRADIHTLFDCGLLAIAPESMTVLVAEELDNSEYRSMRGRRIRLPQKEDQRPSAEALSAHLKRFGWNA